MVRQLMENAWSYSPFIYIICALLATSILSAHLRRNLQFLPDGTCDAGAAAAEVLETSRMIGEALIETPALLTGETTVETVVGIGAAGAEVTGGAGVGAVGGAPPAVAGNGAVAGGKLGSAVKSG